MVDWLSRELRQQTQSKRLNISQTAESTGEVRQRWRRRASSGDPWTPAGWRRLWGWELQIPAGRARRYSRAHINTDASLKVKGQQLTWPQAYMLLWVCDGFTLESRKRAWNTPSSSSSPSSSPPSSCVYMYMVCVFLLWILCFHFITASNLRRHNAVHYKQRYVVGHVMYMVTYLIFVMSCCVTVSTLYIDV